MILNKSVLCFGSKKSHISIPTTRLTRFVCCLCNKSDHYFSTPDKKVYAIVNFDAYGSQTFVITNTSHISSHLFLGFSNGLEEVHGVEIMLGFHTENRKPISYHCYCNQYAFIFNIFKNFYANPFYLEIYILKQIHPDIT